MVNGCLYTPPRNTYYEVGGFQIKPRDAYLAVISPDGSIGEHYNHPQFAVEAKCPFPEKVFTPVVWYTIPHRYVPQLLMEMKALNVNSLLLICWTKQSSTLFNVKFSNDLFQLMEDTIQDVFISANQKPTKTHANVNSL